MSKQRYYNIQSALLQSEQDASKNTSDESKIEAEINQLQIESNRLDNESFYKNQAVTSKLKELSHIQQNTSKMDQDLLLAKAPKEIMSIFLLDYSEFKQEKVIIGESHNAFELQNSLENKFANLEEDL